MSSGIRNRKIPDAYEPGIYTPFRLLPYFWFQITKAMLEALKAIEQLRKSADQLTRQ